MQSVSSNAVAKSLSYSTTEHKTGKKWIDGKDIYECTLNIGNNAQSNSNTIYHYLKMDSLIEYSGNCKILGTKCPIPMFDSSGNFTYKITIYYYFEDYFILMNGWTSMLTDVYITVHYTKTTD